MVAQSVGIDVSKGRLDVHAYPSGVAFAVDRTEAGLDVLAGRSREVTVALIAMEATWATRPWWYMG